MDVVEIAMQLFVTAFLMGFCFWLGHMRGERKGYDQRIEDMRKNVTQAYNKAKADLDVLNAVSPPRQRQVRIKGGSRRNMND